MIRKAIQLAGKTLVISLPNPWVKENDIKKGDEIDVIYRGKELIIKTDKEPYLKTSINVSGMNKKVVRWALTSYYQKGYDEIEIFFDEENIIELINRYIKDLFIGFAIIKQTDKVCVIRSITTEREVEFNSLLRRSFLVSLELGESTLDLIKKRKYSQIDKLINLEITNNQLTLFCNRLINKRKYFADGNHFLFSLIWDLEKIADDFKYICMYLNKISQNEDPKISKETIKIFDEVNRFFREYYEGYYKFSYKRFSEIYDKKEFLIKKAREHIKKTNSHESIIINYLISVVHKVSNLIALTIAINTE
jgi:phosphate uptake regulator